MKISASTSTRRRQEGVAVILMLTLLGIVLFLLGLNLRSLYCLERELKFVEKRQVQRLNGLSVTNAPALDIRATNTNAPPAR